MAVAQLLVAKQETKIDEIDSDGRSPLFLAAVEGDLQFARLLLEQSRKIEMNEVAPTSKWTLLQAARICNPDITEMIELLKQYGAQE